MSGPQRTQRDEQVKREQADRANATGRQSCNTMACHPDYTRQGGGDFSKLSDVFKRHADDELSKVSAMGGAQNRQPSQPTSPSAAGQKAGWSQRPIGTVTPTEMALGRGSFLPSDLQPGALLPASGKGGGLTTPPSPADLERWRGPGVGAAPQWQQEIEARNPEALRILWGRSQAGVEALGGHEEVVVENFNKEQANARKAQQIEQEGHGLAYQVGANVIQAFNPYQEVSVWDAALAFSGLGIPGEGAGMRAGGLEPPMDWPRRELLEGPTPPQGTGPATPEDFGPRLSAGLGPIPATNTPAQPMPAATPVVGDIKPVATLSPVAEAPATQAPQGGATISSGAEASAQARGKGAQDLPDTPLTPAPALKPVDQTPRPAWNSRARCDRV